MLHDRIVSDPKIMFGKPVIKGTRIPVENILRKLAAGVTEADILVQHSHLQLEDIRAAVAYAADQIATEDNIFAETMDL